MFSGRFGRVLFQILCTVESHSVCSNHTRACRSQVRVKSHCVGGNCTFRVEIFLVRVEITLVCVVITFVPLKFTLRVENHTVRVQITL
jgi:hypothetical protein